MESLETEMKDLIFLKIQVGLFNNSNKLFEVYETAYKQFIKRCPLGVWEIYTFLPEGTIKLSARFDGFKDRVELFDNSVCRVAHFESLIGFKEYCDTELVLDLRL
jgi:hypothetical protein